MFPAVMLVLNLSSIAVLWFGGHLVASGSMPVGALTAFLTYLLQILMSVMMATFMFVMVPRAEVCAERIVEVLDTEPDVRPPVQPAGVGAVHGRLELRERRVPLPGRAPAGAARHRAWSPSPARSPRSSAAQAAARRRWSTSSRGCSMRPAATCSSTAWTCASSIRRVLSGLIGLVPQRPYLFSGTVASNLRYGKPDATDAELWRALEIAQARDFVAQMPGGLDAPIAQGGTNVSGGQRQRLAIARAVVHRPEIYLFDDSFSALDYATDAALRAALARETAEATVLIVAQRVATIRNADKIIVLEAGRIVAAGHARRADGTPTRPTGRSCSPS